MNAMRLIPFLFLAPAVAGQTLDSTQIRYRTAIVTVRDALTPVGAQVQSLRRDLGTAADVTIQAKTGRLQAACRGAQATLASQRPVFDGVDGNRQQIRMARALVTAMQTLDLRLREHCLDGLRSGAEGLVADSIRAWMPYRAARIRDAEQAYHEAAAAFARSVNVRIPPLDPRG